MTREEAIQILSDLQDGSGQTYEAIRMAIEALTFEEYGLTCKTCADRNMCIMSAPDGQWKACEDYRPSADLVEVVRCKDCRFAMVRTEEEKNKPIKPQPILCEWFCIGVENDDYCSHGERREE